MLRNRECITEVTHAEDFNITVQTKDGRWRTFDKSKLTNVKHTQQDYDIRLSFKELDDLVSYLLASAANAPKPVRRRNR